jgi:hypothetical protein
MTVLFGISVLLLAGIGGLHMYWAFGGRWGSRVVIPETVLRQPSFIPGKTGTLAVAFLLFAAAALLLLEADLVKAFTSSFVVRWGSWVCAVVFGLRAIGDFRYFGLMKRVRGSRFAAFDSYLFTPLCLWLCFIFLMAIRTEG